MKEDNDLTELWIEYIQNEVKVSKFIPGGEALLFSGKRCGTCIHWHLITEEDLKSKDLAFERNDIIKSLKGKIASIEIDGKFDSYIDVTFYGWCKRYPPQVNQPVVIKKITCQKKISDYNFPLISHDNRCGEWEKNEHIESFKKEVQKKLSETA